MNSPEHVSDLQSRIVRLERLVGLLLLVACVALAAAASTWLAPRELTAQEGLQGLIDADSILTVRGLVVLDETGQQRIRLGAPLPDPILLGKRYGRGGDVAGILLYDGEGNERGGYVTSRRGAALTLDELGRAAIHLGVGDRGDIHLRLSDGRGGFAGLGITPESTFLQLLGGGDDVTLESRADEGRAGRE